jgi:hypothetical protein
MTSGIAPFGASEATTDVEARVGRGVAVEIGVADRTASDGLVETALDEAAVDVDVAAEGDVAAVPQPPTPNASMTTREARPGFIAEAFPPGADGANSLVPPVIMLAGRTEHNPPWTMSADWPMIEGLWTAPSASPTVRLTSTP